MKPSLRIGNVVIAALLVLGIALAVPGQAAVQAAGPTELFFSEYIEGSSNNKALEIYNGTGAPINLAAGAYNVQMFFNGSASAGLTINLTGTVANGDVFVLANSGAVVDILVQADQTNGSGWFNGDDAVVLRKGTTIIDVIGQTGFDPGAEWGAGLVSTADNTLRRKASILAGDPNGSDAFDPSLEWDGYATNTFDGLGSHTVIIPEVDTAPSVSSTNPANGTDDLAVYANLTVTFSEPVDVAGSWFDLTCTTTGTHTAAVSGGPTSFTLDPDTNFVDETCTLNIFAANVTDQDANDPPDAMEADFSITFSAFDACQVTDYTRIFDIQGSGATVAISGPVATRGVVVGDYEGASPALRGFFVQDISGDGDPSTSDGIFVFEGDNANRVSLGDVVFIKGSAGENQGQSQVSSTKIYTCGIDSVDPVDVEFPVPNTTFLEQYEGMLVRLPQTMYVTEHFQLGRFGQVVISADARLQQPTNVVAPGADANALQAANNLNKIILDDASQAQNPDPILFARGGLPLSASNTLRGGDTATGIVGVLNYTWAGNSASGNAYRVRPINALNGYVNFEQANPRPAAPEDVSGTLEAGALNLLNYFNTFDGLPDTVNNCTNGVGGAATDCRGADTQAEFDRQWPKTVAAILGMNVDVLGIVEIENDGYGADSAIQHLVDQLNTAAGPGTYAFIDVDAATGQLNALGTDAIKVGLIYKPAMVTPVGVTAALNSVAFVNGGDGAPRTRPALAQTFQQNSNGARFTVVVNHFKSKGSACDVPDAGDGQGNCNLVRVNAAAELANWLASDPTLTSESDILILGDLNSYAMEDPITALKNAGYTNLLDLFLGPEAYSYVFDGQWGYLDHALATGSLWPQVTGISEFHINADEPSVLDYNTDFKTPNLQTVLYAPDMFRVSDHDPVIVGLDLQNSPYPSDLGFVNGSGWVPAPEGSYHADPAWSGKAQFAIDVKYHKDAVVPEGSFSLVLEKAGFEFFSSNVEWLTVSQDGKYAVFTGFGSANTIDGYRYIVWLQIGKPDYIRFQIWDGTQLVFDNGPLQRLSGNISIHQ
ncbi:MAG: ExeM/NucH family extracellular endonuclease [Bellilinea sp.]